MNGSWLMAKKGLRPRPGLGPPLEGAWVGRWVVNLFATLDSCCHRRGKISLEITCLDDSNNSNSQTMNQNTIPNILPLASTRKPTCSRFACTWYFALNAQTSKPFPAGTPSKKPWLHPDIGSPSSPQLCDNGSIPIRDRKSCTLALAIRDEHCDLGYVHLAILHFWAFAALHHK